MYYPYLHGKQFELIALREFADQCAENCRICPIIEPVKSSFNSLRLAIKKFQEKSVPFALVLNSDKGDFSGKNLDVELELSDLLNDCKIWIPAFKVSSNNVNQILNRLHEKSYPTIILVCDVSIDHSREDFKNLLGFNEVKKVVFAADNNRQFKRELSKLKKEAIRFDDNFKPQKRNSDYIQIPEELFSEEVFYYKTEDNFAGFADYTVLPSEFIEGGMLPVALAIHLTYQKESQIWIRHFVSDTNNDNANIQKKFGEAAQKAIKFFSEIHYSNQAIEELNRYYTEGNYPGLGVIKKISIRSHLELINEILTSQES
jgi:hypothetical protein